MTSVQPPTQPKRDRTVLAASIGAAAAIIAAVIAVIGARAGTSSPGRATVTGQGTVTGAATSSAPVVGGGMSGTASSSGSVAAPTTADSAADVFHQGTLPVAYGQLVDLDSPPSDDNWGVLDHPPAWDVTWNGTALQEAALSFESGSGGVASSNDGRDCRTAAGLSADIPLSQVRPGKTFCVQTSERRRASLRVMAVSLDDNTVNVEIKVYRKASDH